jgi:hypothetical protein
MRLQSETRRRNIAKKILLKKFAADTNILIANNLWGGLDKKNLVITNSSCWTRSIVL